MGTPREGMLLHRCVGMPQLCSLHPVYELEIIILAKTINFLMVVHMSKSLEYLEKLKATFGGASDYKAAQLLDIRQSTIGHWRTGRSSMSVKIAIKCAELLELDPKLVVSEIQEDQAKTEEERLFWHNLAVA